MANYYSLNTFQQVTYIFNYIQLIVAILGIIGNILVFFIFSRPTLKKHSYSFYCRVMAISDIGLLIIYFKSWASYVLDANLDIVSAFFCSISQYLPYFFGGLSITMLTLIASDRMITIVYSNRFTFIKRQWFQWVMVFICIVYNASVNLLPPLNNHIVEIGQNTNSTQSIKMCALDANLTVIQMWILLGNFLLFNIIINNVLNIKMIWFIVSSRRKVTRSLSVLSNSSTRDRKFAATSIGLNLACMVLKLPFAIALLVMNQMVIDFDEFFAIQTIVLTISVMDNGFSFFINLFVNSIFYYEFLILIGVKKRLILSPSFATITSANQKNMSKRNYRP
jgi:hypothetical protein